MIFGGKNTTQTQRGVSIRLYLADGVPDLSEAESADMEAFLDEMLLIYPVLDVKAFEMISVSGDTADRLYLKGAGGAKAEGRETPDGFVVFAGSVARASVVPAIHAYMVALRDKLVAEGVLDQDPEGLLRFNRDYLFGSPSTAAGVVMGRNANGRTEWKDSGGRKRFSQPQSASESRDSRRSTRTPAEPATSTRGLM